MSQSAIKNWERGFKAAAKADGYATFRDHMRRLELPDSPELMLEGTIQMVRACASYYLIDHKSNESRLRQFLAMQQYKPAQAEGASYALTFNIHRKAFPRLFVEPLMQLIDLADLFDHSWDAYELVGYREFYVTRIDWADLTNQEIDHLEKVVTGDLRFDYCEGEINIDYCPSHDMNYLLVGVDDTPRPEEDEKGE